MRKISNVVLCLTAVAGIWWGGPLLLQTWTARQQINEACGGLVPAVPVLALSPAGGTISHRQSDSGTIQLEADLPQHCELFSTEAGEKHGTSSGERWFFTGAVGALPSKTPVTPEDSQDRLLDPYGDPTYPPEPLGGGIVGTVSDSGVTVELPCSDGRANGKPVKKLWARASLTEPGRPFSEKGQLFSSDRNALADIAVRTLNNLAEHAGCTDRLPDAPTDIPALTAGPEGAAHANGTCEWYRKKDFAGDEKLPDQVLESRTDNRLWDERCGLVLGEERAHRLWESVAADRRHSTVHPPSSIGEWYVSLHTYAGEGAENVQLDSIGYDEPPRRAGARHGGPRGRIDVVGFFRLRGKAPDPYDDRLLRLRQGDTARTGGEALPCVRYGCREPPQLHGHAIPRLLGLPHRLAPHRHDRSTLGARVENVAVRAGHDGRGLLVSVPAAISRVH
ncbi:hypothetical protein [Streptomyces sp. AA1529]|uniref:hypothetical protein n=1 Tax=Streptomyces sp. AA1529 TaxID=1203257 RepID=UPI001319BC91|nr:hypothetical protein [Streptomyces sp. AA1529]